MTTINNDLIKRIRMDGDEIRQITADGDIVFNLDADLVLDLFNTGAISADTLGLYQNSIFDSLDVTVSGNTGFTAQSTSQTTSGSNFNITVNGNYQPTSESITIKGSGAYDSVYKNYNDVYSASDTISVGDTAPPENETVSISETTYELNELWSATKSNEFNGENVTDLHSTSGGGNIFIYQGSESQTVDVHNAVTGSQTSSFTIDGATTGSNYEYNRYLLGADSDSVYIGHENSTTFGSYDNSTGAEEWSYNVGGDYGYLASVSQNYVLFATDYEVTLFDKNTGTKELDVTNGAESIDINENANAIAIGKGRTIEVYDLNGNQKFSTSLTNDHYKVFVAIDPTLQDRVHVGVGGSEPGVYYYQLYDLNGTLLASEEADSYYYDGGGSREEATDDIISHGNGAYATISDEWGNDAELHEFGGDGSYKGQESLAGTDGNDLIYGGGVMGAREDDGGKMTFYYVGGGETTVTVGSNTITTSDRPTTKSINLSSGSASVSIDSEPQVDVDIDWDEDNRTTDPSVTIDGSTVSHNGPLANGQTETGSIDITGTGTYTASVSTNGEVTVDVDWSERDVVKDVAFTFNGVTENVTGPILDSEQNTLSFGVSDIIDGDNSVDVTAGGNSNPDLQITFLLNTEDAMALTDFEPNWDYDENGDNVLLEYWFDVSNVDAPAEAVEGDSFSVNATIENIGITPVQQDVVMTHTGETLTKTKNLNDKESINVTFDTVINAVGEQTVVVESPQESASDLIQILSKYQLDISIDGASNINTEINSDYSTNVYPSFSPNVYVNNDYAGSATNNSGENIDVSASPTTKFVERKIVDDSAYYLNMERGNVNITGHTRTSTQDVAYNYGFDPSVIEITKIRINSGFHVENGATLTYDDGTGTSQTTTYPSPDVTLERGTDWPSDGHPMNVDLDTDQDDTGATTEGYGVEIWEEIEVADSVTGDSVS